MWKDIYKTKTNTLFSEQQNIFFIAATKEVVQFEDGAAYFNNIAGLLEFDSDFAIKKDDWNNIAFLINDDTTIKVNAKSITIDYGKKVLIKKVEMETPTLPTFDRGIVPTELKYDIKTEFKTAENFISTERAGLKGVRFENNVIYGCDGASIYSKKIDNLHLDKITLPGQTFKNISKPAGIHQLDDKKIMFFESDKKFAIVPLIMTTYPDVKGVLDKHINIGKVIADDTTNLKSLVNVMSKIFGSDKSSRLQLDGNTINTPKLYETTIEWSDELEFEMPYNIVFNIKKLQDIMIGKGKLIIGENNMSGIVVVNEEDRITTLLLPTRT